VKGLTWIHCLSLLFVAGCVSLSKRGPVDDSVIMARHLCQRGLYAMHNDQWDQAETAFARAVEACPVDQRARQHYADALWRRGATDQAIDQMKVAVKLSGRAPGLLLDLGKMYLDRGKLPDALDQANRAVQADRHLAEAWALRGDALRQQGSTEDALFSYLRALNHSPGDRRVRLEVAELYRGANRPRLALVMLQTLAEQYEPGQEPARVLYLQGLALKALARYDDALRQLALARDRAPPTADLLYQLAEAELITGDLVSAQQDAAEARRRGADERATRALIARIEANRPLLSARRPR
jgi:Flp pilus assembly protein TadD